MYAVITNIVLAAVVLMVVQAETYAMLEAVAYARRVDGGLARKFRVGSARYEWASVIWHETSVEKPAYSIIRTLAVFLVTMVSLVALMDFGNVKVASSIALLGGVLTSIGFFAGKYGASFAAHRKNIATQQREGTWNFA